MISRWLAVLSGLCLLASAAVANAPSISLRPDIRPGASTERVEDAVAAALSVPGLAIPNVTVSPRPIARPGSAVPAKPIKVVLATSGAAVRISPRPWKRPSGLSAPVVRASAVRTVPESPTVLSRQGSVCGDRAIRGQRISAIPGRLRGCGVSKPVRVTEVAGVRLTQPATVNCETAKALKKWVAGSVKPAVGRLGGGVKSLRVAAHYACRTRNHQPGAKISEHGKGNAIDISGIILANGVEMTVLKGWRDRVQGKILKTVHKEACGTFGTVLGPNADRFHQDHFHFDVARHRGGSYCR